MKIALFADYNGGERIWPALEEALEEQRLDLIAFVGDIIDTPARAEEWKYLLETGKPSSKKRPELEQDAVVEELAYREFFINLTGFGVPVVFVPGHQDAPVSRLLEMAEGFSNVYNVHGKPFKYSGYTFAGLGGGIGPVDCDEVVYCSSEKKASKILPADWCSDPEHSILLAHTPPQSRMTLDAGKNTHSGSRVINELIETCKPAFCLAGDVTGSPGQDMLGSTLVVNPGSMFKGRYALVDLEQHRVLFPTQLKM
ncbi:hypothetical protein GX441_07500 [bacterium]|nr:hypothetical protein [bacterium]